MSPPCTHATSYEDVVTVNQDERAASLVVDLKCVQREQIVQKVPRLVDVVVEADPAHGLKLLWGSGNKKLVDRGGAQEVVVENEGAHFVWY